MVIRLDTEIWVIGKDGIKKEGLKRGGWIGEDVCRLVLGFVALVCVWVYFCCCSGGCFCQELQGLWLCTVGTVG
jgi:hypothetical protein